VGGRARSAALTAAIGILALLVGVLAYQT